MNRSRTMAVLLTFFLVALIVAAPMAHAGPGSTKLLKDGQDVTQGNSPHLQGCQFQISWTGFTDKANQTITYNFNPQSPTTGTTPFIAGTVDLDANGNGVAPVVFSAGTLAGLTPKGNQGYHITLIGDVDDTTPSEKKKTFWIERECAALPLREVTLKVEKKIAQGSDQNASFTFASGENDLAGSYTHNTTKTATVTAEGTYTATETVPAGWNNPNVSCGSGGSKTGNNGATFTVTEDHIDAEATITCTFTNSQPQSSTPSADLSITKTDAVDPVTAGDNIVYTLTVSNGGPDTASNVTVADTLPAGLGFVSATPSQGTCNATSPISCSLGTLTSGQSATITVVASTSVATPGTVENTATVSSSTADPVPGNNTDSETTTVLQPDPEKGRIVVTKQTLPDGSSETFQFTGDVAGTLGDGQSGGVNVDAGTYTATEVAKEGWTLSSISCDDNDSSGNVGTATATFNVAEGETVTCTFTNTEDEVLPNPPIEQPGEKDPDPEKKDRVKGAVLPLTGPGSGLHAIVTLSLLLLLSGSTLVMEARRRLSEDLWRQP